MKRCPECGFRADDTVCPLCGVKMQRTSEPVATHKHTQSGETCMLPEKEKSEQKRNNKNPTAGILIVFLVLYYFIRQLMYSGIR